MEITLNGANIVVLARNHNPAIPSKDWLEKKQVIIDEPLNFANTPVFSFFETKNFALTVDQQKWQIVLKVVNQANIEALADITEKYLRALPETPYHAVGLNFQYIGRPGKEENCFEILKSIFVSDKQKITSSINSVNFASGGLIYFDHGQFRVKIAVDPSLKTKKDIAISFNYHLESKKIKEILSNLGKFKKCFQQSNDIANNLLGG